MEKVITLGDVMIRLTAPGFERFMQADEFKVSYVGSEANVAANLSNCGIPSAFVTRFPNHDLGQAAAQSLIKYGVDTSHIVYGEGRLGAYYLENGAMQRSSRIIYDRFDSAFANIETGMIDWDEILKDALWFHWSGITPAISQGAADVCKEAILAARKYAVTVSGDINYRRNLWQYGKTVGEVMPELIELTDIIVGGQVDIENCLNISSKSFEDACKKVMKSCPIVKKVAVIERNSISASHNKISGLLWNGKEMIHSKEYDLTHIVDRVGAGDAFMSGLIYGWIKNKTDEHTLDFAVASCALKHSIEGDVNISKVEEIEQLIKGENIGKLLR
jgi:2-dehydro-3-deoxygluconokinase